MPQFVIDLGENYDIPEILRTLPANEWEIVLNYIAELMIKHNNNFSNITEETIRSNMENKYNIDLTDLKKKLATEMAANKQLNEQLALQKDLLKEELDAILQKQRELNDNNLKTQLEYQRKSLTEANIAEIERKNATILSFETEIAAIKAAHERKTAALEQNLAQELSKKYESERLFLEESYKTRLEYNRLDTVSKYEAEKSAIEAELSSQKLELKRLIDNNSKIEAEYKESLTNQVNLEKKYHEREIALMRERIEQLTKENININELNNSAITKEFLVSVINPAKNQLPVIKGQEGEEQIENYLKYKYIRSKVILTNKEKSKGDMYFQWHGIRCMVEVKNKEILILNDVEKFEKDIITLLKQNKINCAIFVSLKTNNIPHKTRDSLQLEYFKGIPIIYLYVDHEQIIACAIALLDKLLTINVSSNNQLEELKANFLDYYKHCEDEYKYLERLIKEKTKEISSLSLRRDTIEKKFLKLQQEYPKHISTKAIFDGRKPTDDLLVKTNVDIEVKTNDTEDLLVKTNVDIEVKTNDNEDLSNTIEVKNNEIKNDDLTHRAKLTEFFKQQRYDINKLDISIKIDTWAKTLTKECCFDILKYISTYNKHPKRDDLTNLSNGKRIMTMQEFAKLSAGDRKATKLIVKFAEDFYSAEYKP
jgi:hypothetical protein